MNNVKYGIIEAISNYLTIENNVNINKIKKFINVLKKEFKDIFKKYINNKKSIKFLNFNRIWYLFEIHNKIWKFLEGSNDATLYFQICNIFETNLNKKHNENYIRRKST